MRVVGFMLGLVVFAWGCASLDERIAGLAKGDPADRVEAVNLLSTTGKSDRLVPFLQDSSGLVRAAAVAAMGRFPGEEAFGPVALLAPDANPYVRMEVARALGRMPGPKGARRTVLERLLNVNLESNRLVRQRAADSLGRIGDPDSVPALMTALDDPDGGVRFLAARSLTSLTGEHFGVDPDRWRAWFREWFVDRK